MKKNILIILILILKVSVNAQSSKIKFGIKSGVNLSKYTPETYFLGSKTADYQGKIGFYIGGYTNIEISDKFKIQPELLFSNQGTKRIYENKTLSDSYGVLIGPGDIEGKINESVITLPIILQYFINNNFNLEGGIQLGYIIDRNEETTKNPFEQFLENNFENNNINYDKFDFGFNIGLGYKILENVRVNTKYFLGVIERDNSIKSSIFSLGIEYEI